MCVFVDIFTRVENNDVILNLIPATFGLFHVFILFNLGDIFARSREERRFFVKVSRENV